MLEELRDIHLPNAISWWPPAIGWWLIALAMLSLLLLFLYFRKPKMIRHALKLLGRIEKDFGETKDASKCLRELSRLLRRVAITKQMECAGITGHEWLQHLDKGLQGSEFTQGVGKILLDGPYQPRVEGADVPNLILLCRKWVVSK